MNSKIYILIFFVSFPFLDVKSQPEIEHYNKGEVLRYKGDYKNAEQEYLRAIKINPNLYDAIIELAIIEYDINKNYENALNYLEYIIQNTKDSELLMKVYLHKGIVYTILKDDKEALKMFNKGIAIKGVGESKALLYAARGYEIYYFNNELNKALADFEKSIQTHPTPEAYKSRGELFYSIDNYEEAEKDFMASLKLEGDSNLLHYYLGKTRRWAKKYELSLQDLEQVNVEELAFYSQEYVPDYYYFRGAIKYYLERYDEAASDLEKSISITDTVADVLHRLGRSYLKLNKYKEAIKVYTRALELIPDNEYYNKDLGICYYELGEYQKSEEYLSKAVSINNQNIAIHKELAKLRIAQAKYDKALEQISTAMALSKEQDYNSEGELEYYRAIIYFKLEKKEDGCADLEKALEYGFDKNKVTQLRDKHCQ